MTEVRPALSSLVLPALAAFVCAALVYMAPGNLGELYHDDAIFMYGGQEMVRGKPVYVGMFDHKGPLSQMVCGLGVWIAGWIGRDDLITTRYLFLVIASSAAAGVFVLASTLFRSRLVGFLASSFFASFWGYGVYAFSGTRPKMLMTLFEIAALVFLARRRWFWAGLAVTLSAFTWQPTGVYFFVVLLLAWFQSGPDRRRRALLNVFLGGLLPTVLITGYFAAVGALGPFLDGCFLFNLRYLENPGTLRGQLTSILRILIYSGMGVPTYFGLLALPVLYLWRIRAGGAGALLHDRFAGVLLTLPFPVLWSLHDFQQYPDFFIFLPYVALTLGWVAHSAARGIGAALRLEGRALDAAVLLPGLCLMTLAAIAMRQGTQPLLPAQWAAAREIQRTYGDERIAAIGVPEALVLLRRSNVTRYGFVMRGIGRYIEENEPGGFRGWLQSISDAEPDVLILRRDYPERLREFAEPWEEWLRGYERLPDKVGDWNLYVPRGEDRSESTESAEPPRDL